MSGQFSVPDDGDESDRLLNMFRAMDPEHARSDPNLPPGYRAATPSEHGVFFSPADLAKAPELAIPSTLWALPDLSTPESQRLAEATWEKRAAEVEAYQKELGFVLTEDTAAEAIPPRSFTLHRGD